MAKINQAQIQFKSWDQIIVGSENVAAVPSWKNGWSRTFLYFDKGELYYENLTIVGQLFRCYLHPQINKAALINFFSAKSILLEVKPNERFRNIVESKLMIQFPKVQVANEELNIEVDTKFLKTLQFLDLADLVEKMTPQKLITSYFTEIGASNGEALKTALLQSMQGQKPEWFDSLPGHNSYDNEDKEELVFKKLAYLDLLLRKRLPHGEFFNIDGKDTLVFDEKKYTYRTKAGGTQVFATEQPEMVLINAEIVRRRVKVTNIEDPGVREFIEFLHDLRPLYEAIQKDLKERKMISNEKVCFSLGNLEALIFSGVDLEKRTDNHLLLINKYLTQVGSANPENLKQELQQLFNKEGALPSWFDQLKWDEKPSKKKKINDEWMRFGDLIVSKAMNMCPRRASLIYGNMNQFIFNEADQTLTFQKTWYVSQREDGSLEISREIPQKPHVSYQKDYVGKISNFSEGYNPAFLKLFESYRQVWEILLKDLSAQPVILEKTSEDSTIFSPESKFVCVKGEGKQKIEDLSQSMGLRFKNIYMTKTSIIAPPADIKEDDGTVLMIVDRISKTNEFVLDSTQKMVWIGYEIENKFYNRKIELEGVNIDYSSFECVSSAPSFQLNFKKLKK